MAVSLKKGECRLGELLGNMRPAELARRMGVHRSTVIRWINNEREMREEETILAARILDRHSEELHHWIEVPRASKRRDIIE